MQQMHLVEQLLGGARPTHRFGGMRIEPIELDVRGA